MAEAVAYEEQRRRQVEANKRKLEELQLHHLYQWVLVVWPMVWLSLVVARYFFFMGFPYPYGCFCMCMQALVYRKYRRAAEKRKFNFGFEISIFQREF